MNQSVSIDLWDTILRRRCQPDEVKLFTARHIYLRYFHLLQTQYRSPAALLRERIRQERAIGAQRRLSGDDDEYGIAEVLQSLLDHVLKPGTGLPENALHDILEAEQRHEYAVSYEDKGIRRFLDKHTACRRYIVSDFYMGQEFCSSLLAEKSPWLAPDGFYVSCDHGINKRSGRLLKKMLSTEKLRADHHAHIGDSRKSDVQLPSRLGAHGVLYNNFDEENLRTSKARRYKKRVHSIAPYIDELAQQLNGSTAACACAETAEQQEFFRIGRASALIFHGLVLQAIETALKENIDRIYYISREGLFFQKIHEHISSPDLFGMPVPAAVHLEVSRLSTFLPSLRDISCDELMRLWCFYTTQSPRALLTSLGADAAPFLPLLARHGLDPDVDIASPWQDRRIRSFLSDRDALAMLHTLRHARRDTLMAYLAEKGITAETQKVLLVDIGWKGTIQDNLAHLFPDSRFFGTYFALQRFRASQPSNTVKASFGPDENSRPGKSKPVNCIAPWELLCTSGEGSAASYETIVGRVTIRRDCSDAEQTVYAQKIRFFQEGVLSASPCIADWISTYAVTAGEIRPHCLRAMADVSADPPMALVKTFFTSEHNESFGLGRRVSMAPPSPMQLILTAARSVRCYRELKMLIIKTRWPFGYLKLYGLNRLLRLFKKPFP